MQQLKKEMSLWFVSIHNNLHLLFQPNKNFIFVFLIIILVIVYLDDGKGVYYYFGWKKSPVRKTTREYSKQDGGWKTGRNAENAAGRIGRCQTTGYFFKNALLHL